MINVRYFFTWKKAFRVLPLSNQSQLWKKVIITKSMYCIVKHSTHSKTCSEMLFCWKIFSHKQPYCTKRHNAKHAYCTKVKFYPTYKIWFLYYNIKIWRGFDHFCAKVTHPTLLSNYIFTRKKYNFHTVYYTCFFYQQQ